MAYVGKRLSERRRKGLFFNTYVEFVVGARILGEFMNFRQIMLVSVNVSNREIVPLI
jgi:hypothetical protein